MLLIIVPVLFLTFYFAWHYRHSNKKAKYDPVWRGTFTPNEIAA